MKELLNRDSGVLIRSLMRATVPWRSTFVYAVMVCLLLPHALTLWVFSFIFSGLLCLPLQSIWLLCHDDQYHGACPHLLRNYAATRHVSVTLHSSVENVQSDAVSQVFNWKSLKSLFLVAGASCVALRRLQSRWGTRDSMMMLFYPHSYYYSKTTLVMKWIHIALQIYETFFLQTFSDIGHRWAIWWNPWWIPSRRYFPCS